MDILQTLGTAITFGSALGATIAGFFAYKQKTLVTLLRESNNDYKDRVIQLEKLRDDDRRVLDHQTEEIKLLRREKALPLENLTTLIVEQHTQQLTLLKDIAEALNKGQHNER